MKILGSKAYEDIYLGDPDQDPNCPHWRIDFSDANIAKLLKKTQNAVEDAQYLSSLADNALTEEEELDAKQKTVELEKKVITAFIGKDGYNQILQHLSPTDEPVNPMDYIAIIGDIFVIFLELLVDKGSLKQVRRVTNKINSGAE